MTGGEISAALLEQCGCVFLAYSCTAGMASTSSYEHVAFTSLSSAANRQKPNNAQLFSTRETSRKVTSIYIARPTILQSCFSEM
jgi:hypothetical protein